MSCVQGGGVVENRQIKLLLVLQGDPSFQGRFAESNGTCALHALDIASRGGSPAQALTRVHGLRLIWELEEVARKGAWAARHEARGPEFSVWYRAASSIDGRVFLGGPAEDLRNQPEA